MNTPRTISKNQREWFWYLSISFCLTTLRLKEGWLIIYTIKKKFSFKFPESLLDLLLNQYRPAVSMWFHFKNRSIWWQLTENSLQYAMEALECADHSYLWLGHWLNSGICGLYLWETRDWNTCFYLCFPGGTSAHSQHSL